MITFENLELWMHFIGMCKVCIWRSSGQGQGHRSKKAQKSLFPQCKTVMGNKSGSIEGRAMKFVRVQHGIFFLSHIEWCDRHVTGSEPA